MAQQHPDDPHARPGFSLQIMYVQGSRLVSTYWRLACTRKEHTMNHTDLENTSESGSQPQPDPINQRREPRVKTSVPVVLTVLGIDALQVMEACTLNVSEHGLRLRVPQPIPAGTLIKADALEIRMLGQVLRCVPMDGAYHVGVRLFHPIADQVRSAPPARRYA
jgi:hypothetical protein